MLINPRPNVFFILCWSPLICYEKNSPSKVALKGIYVNVCVCLSLSLRLGQVLQIVVHTHCPNKYFLLVQRDNEKNPKLSGFLEQHETSAASDNFYRTPWWSADLPCERWVHLIFLLSGGQNHSIYSTKGNQWCIALDQNCYSESSYVDQCFKCCFQGIEFQEW